MAVQDESERVTHLSYRLISQIVMFPLRTIVMSQS